MMVDRCSGAGIKDEKKKQGLGTQRVHGAAEMPSTLRKQVKNKNKNDGREAIDDSRNIVGKLDFCWRLVIAGRWVAGRDTGETGSPENAGWQRASQSKGWSVRQWGEKHNELLGGKKENA